MPALRNVVIDHINALTTGHNDLAESLPAEAFARDLGVRSNEMGEQFWCVVGARESYTNAIVSDGWTEFTCSLSTTVDQKQVVQALHQSQLALQKVVGQVEWTDTRDDLLLALLEHEAQHQGQLIRYVYALGYSFPESWAEAWGLGS